MRGQKKNLNPDGTFDCISCGEPKDVSEFHVNRASPLGFRYQCKKCKSGYSRARNSDPDIRKKNIASSAKWYSGNKERHKNLVYSRMHLHREYRVNYTRNWQKSETGRICHTENRHRRRDLLSGKYTPSEWRALIDASGNACLSCGTPASECIYCFRRSGNLIGKLTPDHIVPLSKGGHNVIGNLQGLCMPCQLKKRAKIIDFRPAHVKAMFPLIIPEPKDKNELPDNHAI